MVPALHLLKKLPQSSHSPPDITSCPPTSTKQQISEQQNGINILEAPHMPGAPGSPLFSEFGQVNNTTARLAHGSVAWLLQLLEQEQIPVSPGGAHSLANQYQHSKCSQPCRDISPQQQNSLPKLLSYTRVAKSNTWNYCPGKD